MDQHGKEDENNSQDSVDRRKVDAAAAAAAALGDETAGLLEDVGSEQASPSVAHPSSLLQFLLRACAGCLGLHGCCGGDQKPAAGAATEASAAGAAAATSSSEEAGGEKTKGNGFFMPGVIARVWAVRTPRPPDHASEGSGGNGGVHH